MTQYDNSSPYDHLLPGQDRSTLPDGWPVVPKSHLIGVGVFAAVFMLLVLVSRHHAVFLVRWVNLAIHEGGHMVCRPFGLTIHVWGGTLFQCLMPLAIGVYFWRRRQPAGAAVAGLWLGQNLAEISIYAADARLRGLPLLFGRDSIHDWHYMLNRLGCLDSCRTIASVIYVTGWLIMLAAVAWYVWRWRVGKNHVATSA